MGRRANIAATLVVLTLLRPALAQPAATSPATGGQATAPTPAQSDRIYLSYRQAIDREIASYRDATMDLRARRADAVAKAEAALQRTIDSADSAYRAGTSRAYEQLEAARKARNAAAIQAYDRDIKSLNTAGELEKAAALTKAKDQFINSALEEGAKLQAESVAVASLPTAVKQAGPAPRTRMITLHVRTTIDGSDELLVTAEYARWINKSWGMPHPVDINGINWVPSSSPVLQNAGSTAFLPSVDFSLAVVKARSGRDIVACERSLEGLRIVFADAPNGSDAYEITIELPAK